MMEMPLPVPFASASASASLSPAFSSDLLELSMIDYFRIRTTVCTLTYKVYQAGGEIR